MRPVYAALGLSFLLLCPHAAADRLAARHSWTIARRPRGSRAASPRQSRSYRRAIKRWQTPSPGLRSTWRDGMHEIVFSSVNTGEEAAVRLFRPDGTLDSAAVLKVRRICRDWRTSTDHELDPRLLSLVYRLAAELDTPQIRVISGFRAPRPGNHSHHGEGRAIDLVVPGIPIDRVAEVARGFGHVGVGTYPTSGFVHLDVRDRSFFWVDRSGPGQRNRLRQVRRTQAWSADHGFDPADEVIRPSRPTKVALRPQRTRRAALQRGLDRRAARR